MTFHRSQLAGLPDVPGRPADRRRAHSETGTEDNLKYRPVIRVNIQSLRRGPRSIRLRISVWQTHFWKKPIIYAHTHPRTQTKSKSSKTHAYDQKHEKSKSWKTTVPLDSLQPGRHGCYGLQLVATRPRRERQYKHSELRVLSKHCNHQRERHSHLDLGWLPS